MIQRKRRSRAGFTLIEILTVLTITTFILASVGIVISSLHRLNRKLRDDFPADAQLARLGIQFRSDIHASQKIELIDANESNVGLLLTTAEGHNIEYRSDQNRIARNVTRGDQAKRREEFVLRRGAEVDWSLVSDSTLATLSIRRHSGQIPGSIDDLRVTTFTAAVNLDQPTRK